MGSVHPRFARAYLEITNCCNLACAFCHGTARAMKVMRAEEFELLTDRLQGQAEYLYFHLLGEPLTHPLLPEFIHSAVGKGFRPMLTTNGTLLPERSAALLETPLYKISISLHAPEGNGVFAGPEYLAGCTEFARRASDAGIITVLRLWNLGGMENGNNTILDTLHREFPGPWNEIRSGYRLKEKVFLEWGQKFDWPDLALPEIGREFFCYGLRDQIGILADGTVVPCCLDAEGAISLGNLFDSTLEDILSSPRAKALYNGFTKHFAAEALCRRCGYAALKEYHKG